MEPSLMRIGYRTIAGCFIWFAVVWTPDLYAADPPKPEAHEAAPPEIESSPATHPQSDGIEADLQAKRAQAAKELSRIDAPATLRAGAPAGVPETELMERRSLLQELVQIYERHFDELGKLGQTHRRLQELERQSREWTAFPDPPPYSVLIVDDLRDAARSTRLTAQGIQSRLTMTQNLADSTREALKNAQGQARQAAEHLEGVRDPVKLERLAWIRDLAQLRERVAAARAAMLDTAQKQIQEELTEANERAAFLDRQRRTAEEHIRFGEDDLKAVTARLDEEHRKLSADLDRALAQQAAQRRAVTAAEDRVAAARRTLSSKKKTAAVQQRRLAQLDEAVELERVRYDNANLEVDSFRQLLGGIRQERHVWDMRFASAQETISVAEDREALAKLTATMSSIERWREYGFQQLSMISGQAGELRDRIHETPPPRNAAHLRAMVDALQNREALYRPVLQHTDALLRLIETRQEEFAQRQQTRPWSVRIRDWATSAATAMQQVWNIELFAAEDTIEVEGKSITGRRSITIGKVLKALAMLIGGYWLSVILARFAQRKAVSRFHIDPNVADIIRQWALAFFFTMLVILTLMSVKIPLTAFAFLGGALAIGVGFGTQNLLKNVISGILLLMERPLRVGDVIEVDGIRGMVTTIGLRSSTIRDSTGVETLIPNSTLLERNLTNWTYSSYQKRYSLRVTVATGPAALGVKDLLTQVALAHDQVLKKPDPLVLLDEFKEEALVFSLQYWIEIGPAVDPAEIASDLRFLIEAKLAEAGIARK
jgi:small-conductance mechanosensitive channel